MRNQNNFLPGVSLLTAGRDRHYSLGLAMALVSAGIKLDIIGSDELESPELRQSPRARFLNLRGDQSINAGLRKKMWRVLVYYLRLMAYAVITRSKIFHILWNNKFELFDRTLLMVFYKMLGKRIVLTAHNINTGKRDGYDSSLNRASLKFQYRLCDRIFVHTEKMRRELISEFNVREEKIVLIPFGINNAVPDTTLTGEEARQQLGLGADDKVMLFFGNIAPYKGLEFLVEAFAAIPEDSRVRLIIAGRPKGPKSYWEMIQQAISRNRRHDSIITRVEYIRDEQIEVYFKAADVLVLPYVDIFQSGVLFLAFSFGLPVVATDVGSLKEEVIEGKTGFVCEPKNTGALARSIENYFQSDLYRELKWRRREIQDLAREKYSWEKVQAITTKTYSELLHQRGGPDLVLNTKKNNEAFSFDSHSSL